MDAQNREHLIRGHLDEIRRLEVGPADSSQADPARWPPQGYYLLWHVLAGLTLGVIGAMVSLALNVAGAPLFGQPALQLIRVYLTFPMGDRAMDAQDGVVLFVGCVLYLCTGAVYGCLFHVAMSWLFREVSVAKRVVAATVFGLLLWVVNFYLILSWLQPVLLGDNWIVRLVPVPVAALTHLVFAWTLLVGELWGGFDSGSAGGVSGDLT